MWRKALVSKTYLRESYLLIREELGKNYIRLISLVIFGLTISVADPNDFCSDPDPTRGSDPDL